MYVPHLPSLTFACFGARNVPLLPAHRLVLSLLCCWDILRFSATQHTRDTDNPEKTPVTALLLRCLALLALSLVGYLLHAGRVVSAATTPTTSATTAVTSSGAALLPPRSVLVRSFLQSFSFSFAARAVSVLGVSLLLTPRPLPSSLLPTAVFALHSAFVCLPLSTSDMWAGSSDSAPLLCAWLSCYWLALDHDDRWQIWPLAALLALHTSHAAIAVVRAIRSQSGKAKCDEAIKPAPV